MTDYFLIEQEKQHEIGELSCRVLSILTILQAYTEDKSFDNPEIENINNILFSARTETEKIRKIIYNLQTPTKV